MNFNLGAYRSVPRRASCGSSLRIASSGSWGQAANCSLSPALPPNFRDAARIAGVLSMFEDPDAHQIDANVLLRGITLSGHYAEAALRLHGQSRLNVDLMDAELLLQWARHRADRGLISLPDIVQTGPNRIRETATARRLVGILEQHRRLERVPGTVKVNGKERREVWRVLGGIDG